MNAPLKNDRVDTVKGLLVKVGFQAMETPPEGVTLRHCRLWRRIHDVVPVCLTNDKLHLFINLHVFGQTGGRQHVACSFEIAGQMPDGDWGKQEVYGIQIDEIMKKLPAVEEKLIKGWQAMCAD